MVAMAIPLLRLSPRCASSLGPSIRTSGPLQDGHKSKHGTTPLLQSLAFSEMMIELVCWFGDHDKDPIVRHGNNQQSWRTELPTSFSRFTS